MTIYLTTDTHFNHRLPIERGYRPPDFEQRIIDGFGVLTKDDTLIHLGDICFGKPATVHREIIEPLPCKKILVIGNHDNKRDEWYKSHGWDEVYQTYTYEGIMFTHKPSTTLNFCWRFPNIEVMDINIHGHLHNTGHHDDEFDLQPWHKLLAIEEWDYKLVKLNDFVKEK